MFDTVLVLIRSSLRLYMEKTKIRHPFIQSLFVDADMILKEEKTIEELIPKYSFIMEEFPKDEEIQPLKDFVFAISRVYLVGDHAACFNFQKKRGVLFETI